MMKEKGINGLGTAKSLSNSSSLFSGFQFSQGAEMKGRFSMKKLMFAAAAILAGVAVAEVESDNVVGYTNDTIDQFGGSSSVITPQFIGVGADGKVALDSIKCPDAAYNKIALMLLNGDGSTKTQYNWGRKRVDGVWKYGWIDETSSFAEGVTFDPGQAFWLQNDGEEGLNTFNSSGEVNQKDVEFLLAADGNSVICGNSTPVAVDLQDFLCPEAAYNKIALMLLNGDGSTKTQYNWGRKRVDGAWKYGWIDETSSFAEGVSFKAGQGFWVQNDGSEADANTLTIPGVELK